MIPRMRAILSKKAVINPNLLTANISTGTDTLGTTDGFTGNDATIESSTEDCYSGSRSLKATYRNSYYDNVLFFFNFDAEKTYTLSLRFKSSNTTHEFRLATYGGYSPVFNPTGEWELVTYTFQYDGVSAIYIQHIDNISSVAYMDEFKLEEGSEATDWVIGTG